MNRRQVQGVTIDSASTRDIDDALWIEQKDGAWHILVSIADVSASIPPGGELDLRAKEMVATKYFRVGNSPMLPRHFSEDKLSLWPGQERETLTVDMTLDARNEVVRTEIYPSLLKSQARCPYDRVPSIRKDPTHEGHHLISLGCGIALQLLEGRRSSGAMVLYDLNNGWVTTEDGFLRKIENKDEVIGHILIQEMMILANSMVAEFAVKNNIPVLYRNHTAMSAAPDRAILMQQVEAALTTAMADLDQVRHRVHMLLSRANYGVSLLGHYGLNIPAYVHFTSPIRRYADLVTQRQIKAFIEGKPLPYNQADIATIAQHINTVLEAEREKTSEIFKDKADTKAQRAVDSRRLDGLDAIPFERVTKVEARSGADPSDAFRENFLLRLKENRVPLICLGVILTQEQLTEGWGILRQGSLDFLAHHPEHAVSILAMATQTAGWKETTYKVSNEGPDHTKVFACEATNGDFSGLGTGATSKAAKQNAAVLLLAHRSGMAVTFKRQDEVVPTPPVDTRDSVSALMDYLQRSRSPAPTFQFEKTGPDHALVITCTCTIEHKTKGTIVQKGSGSSKQNAKKEAAAAILKSL